MEKQMTILDLMQLKKNGHKVAAVSCYDYTSACLVAQTGVEMILVGDSAAQIMLGYDSTLPATMDLMTTLTAAVRRGAPNVCLVADMPFLSYQTSIADAVRNAGRFVQEAGVQIVKIEVTAAHLDVIKAVGPRDHFLGQRHTREFMHKLDHSDVIYVPTRDGGYRDPLEVAREKTDWILENHHPEPLSEHKQTELTRIIDTAERELTQ